MGFDYSSQEVLNIAQGAFGYDIIDDTDTHTGDWGFVKALTDATFDVVLDDALLSGNWNSRTLSRGDSFWGKITSVKLTSGTLLAYRRSYES